MTAPTADDVRLDALIKRGAHINVYREQAETETLIAQMASGITDLRAELAEARRLLDDAKVTMAGIAGATARAWELPRNEFLEEFQPWAQSRARHTVERLARPVPPQSTESPYAHWNPATREYGGNVSTNFGTQPFVFPEAEDGVFVAGQTVTVEMPQPSAAPEAVAKDAERYRACRYAALAADNDPLIEQMLDWPNVSTADEFDIQSDQIAAILSANEVKK